MLSIRNITSAKQAAHYFEKDDYYLDHEQRSPSCWWGSGAESLGLRGEVGREKFSDLLNGKLPDGKTQMPQGPDGKRRPGLDMTFSAPKSVSLIGLVGERGDVIDAHEKAVSAALQYMEKHAARTRETKEGVTTTVGTENLVVARFNHDTSRSLDPQLHTHCVVMNLTQRRDGKWRSLANEEIYRKKMLAGALYRSTLALELTRLGYEVERTHLDGRFEVKGVSQEQLAAFSQRRRDVEEGLKRYERVLEAKGLKGAQAAEWVTQRTRKSKRRDLKRESLHALWHTRVQEVGLELPKVKAEGVRAPSISPPAPAPTPNPLAADSRQPVELEHFGYKKDPAKAAVMRAADHYIERAAVIRRDDILQRASSYGLGKFGFGDVENAIDALLKKGDLLPATVERAPGEVFYTTPRAVATESACVASVLLSRQQVAPIVPPAQCASRVDALAAIPLTQGQRAAAELLLTTQDRVVGVQGYAGTGKTTMLQVVRQAAQEAGYEVKGCAPSAAAALVLQSEAGIESTTVARHINMQARAAREQLSQAPVTEAQPLMPQMWIVDECSLLGSNQAHEILKAAERANARVVLVGDRDQMPSVEAGRIFELLGARGMAVVTMPEVMRQKDETLLHAVKSTIAKQWGAAIEAVKASTAKGGAIQAARAYIERKPELRENTLIVTGSNGERKLINETIRDDLNREGRLKGAQTPATVLVGQHLTKVEARDSVSYAMGTLVRFNRSYRGMDIQKDSIWRVTARDLELNRITLKDTGSDRVVVWEPHRADKVEAYTPEPRTLMAGDLVRWTRNDPTKGRRNGETAAVLSVDGAHVTVRVGGAEQVLDLGRERHWDHGYCSTVHAAQGRTCDEVIIQVCTKLKTLTGHESWYVALSRARHKVTIFADDLEKLPKAIAQILKKDSAVEATELHQAQTKSRSRSMVHRL